MDAQVAITNPPWKFTLPPQSPNTFLPNQASRNFYYDYSCNYSILSSYIKDLIYDPVIIPYQDISKITNLDVSNTLELEAVNFLYPDKTNKINLGHNFDNKANPKIINKFSQILINKTVSLTYYVYGLDLILSSKHAIKNTLQIEDIVDLFIMSSSQDDNAKKLACDLIARLNPEIYCLIASLFYSLNTIEQNKPDHDFYTLFCMRQLTSGHNTYDTCIIKKVTDIAKNINLFNTNPNAINLFNCLITNKKFIKHFNVKNVKIELYL